MSKRILTVLSLSCALAFAARQMAAQDRVPVQAELVRAIEAGRVKAGDPIFAKVEPNGRRRNALFAKGLSSRGELLPRKCIPKRRRHPSWQFCLTAASAMATI